MYKKGVSPNAGIWTLVGLVFILIIFFGWFMVSQTSVEKTEKDIEEKEKTIQLSKKGDSASADFFVYDLEASSITTPVSANLYVQDKNSGSFIIDGTAIGISTRKSAGTTIGKHIRWWAGLNASLYPNTDKYERLDDNGAPITINPMDYEIKDENPTLDAYVHKICEDMDVLAFDDTNFKSSSSTGLVNWTLPASSTSTDVSKIKIEANGTNCAYNLGVIYFDVPVEDNITKIDPTGSVVGTISKNPLTKQTISASDVSIVGADIPSAQLEIFGDLDDFIYEFDSSSEAGHQPIMLHEGDYIQTPPVELTTDGDGCTDASAEAVVAYIDDKTCIRSAKEAKVLCDRIADDADSPSNKGFGRSFASTTLYCRAS